MTIHRVRIDLNLQESQQIDCSIQIPDVMCIQKEKYSLFSSDCTVFVRFEEIYMSRQKKT